jgi:hypothetical protein
MCIGVWSENGNGNTIRSSKRTDQMFGEILRKWGANKVKIEIDDFVRNLSAMDGTDLGMIVAIATDTRHTITLKYDTWDLLSPDITCLRHPNIALELGSLIKGCQKTNNLTAATSLMVWLFTVRGAIALECLQSARNMWGELERGFPHVESCARNVAEGIGVTPKILDIRDYDRFPDGQTPEVL